MILELLALLIPCAMAQEEPSEEPEETVETSAVEDPLSEHRAPFDVLAERTIGTASKPVEFNWRRTNVQLAVAGNHLFELNNFNSLRSGMLVRLPREDLMLEFGLSYVWVWDTPSSTQLALTPYRQPGRPERVEMDFTVGLPLAEGVVTTFPRIFPAAELVFSAYGGLRYLFYPTSLRGLKVRETVGALFSPTLTGTEVNNLEDDRKEAMIIDPARYGLMAGLGNDIYFKQGVFFSPRMMFAIPLLAPATETNLYFWADLSLAVGVAW